MKFHRQSQALAARPLFVALVTTALGGAAHGGIVTAYGLIKGAVFDQTSNAPPPPATNWYYYAGVGTSVADAFDGVGIDGPGVAFDQNMPVLNPYQWLASGGNASAAQFEALIPQGTYTYYASIDDKIVTTGEIELGPNLYPSAPPTLMGDTYARLQSLNPFKRFTLDINPWTPSPSATWSGTVLYAYDFSNGIGFYYGSFSPSTNSITIPRGELMPGTLYWLQPWFSNQVFTPAAGFDGAPSDVHYTFFNYVDFQTPPHVPDPAPATTIIDFEELAEGTIVESQYAAVGVVFGIDGSPTQKPIVAVAGLPQVAFAGAGADGPMASGTHGLTDPISGGSTTSGADIRMDIDPPATSVRLSILDVDGTDSVVVRAYSRGAIVDSMTITAGQPSTGNGAITEVFLIADAIDAVVVDAPESIGWGLDFVVVTRACVGVCGPRVRVAQESAPGAGDFDAHILGDVAILRAPGSAAYFYAWNGSWNGQSVVPAQLRGQMFVAKTTDGLVLYSIEGRPYPLGSAPGNSEMEFSFTGAGGAPTILVKDDPDDEYDVDEANRTVRCRNAWQWYETDGVAIGGLAPGTTALVRFTDVDGMPATSVMTGLAYWTVASADGTFIKVDLATDRRVRLDVMPDPNCLADLSVDGIVDGADLGIVLGSWGGDGLGDLNEDGMVDGADMGLVLAAWGACIQ